MNIYIRIKKIIAFIYCLGRKPELYDDPEKGTDVMNITTKPVSDASECTTIFRQAFESMLHTQTDYGQAEAKSTMIFNLDLIKVE